MTGETSNLPSSVRNILIKHWSMGSVRIFFEPNRTETDKVKSRTEPKPRSVSKVANRTDRFSSVRFGSVQKPNRSQHCFLPLSYISKSIRLHRIVLIFSCLNCCVCFEGFKYPWKKDF